MIDNDFLQQLSAKAAALFPAADAARQKLEKEINGLLQTSLTRMNVVTKEEFAAQTRLLEQARAQIAALEQKVTALEAAKQ
ncbi:MAG: accessory factor UbiK family protein [Pseudomonadota bacterium]|nr:accessory factor UbiK family protein [Pseudomonadota bacterium]